MVDMAPWKRAFHSLGWTLLLALPPLALVVVGALLVTEGGRLAFLSSGTEVLSTRPGSTLARLAGVVLPFAFGAGMVSAVNPCGVALLPACIGLYFGDRPGSPRLPPSHRLGRAVVVGGAMTAGFVVLYGLAGALPAGGLRALAHVLPWIGLAIGVLLIVSGVWLLRGNRLYSGLPARLAAQVGDPSDATPRGYFLFGLGYGVASLSCTLPVFWP